MRIRSLICAMVCAVSVAPGAHAQRSPARAATREALVARLDSLLRRTDYRTAHWGMLIVDPERADTLYSHNAEKLMMPASNLKIITAAAALAELGPDFRFSTRVAMTGNIRDTTLDGDLIVIGSGDPSFSDKIRGDATLGLRDMADSVLARGIKRIDGRLRRAISVFPDSPIGLGWEWEDLREPYGAGVGDLMYNDSFTTARVTLEGTVELGSPARTGFRNFLEAFDASLQQRGVRVRMSYDWLFPVADSGLRELFSYSSPPLREILPHFMKPSQNQIGEVLLRTIGRVRTGVGSADSGAAVVTRRLRQWGADSMGFVVRDGSGLSRHNFLSPETIMRVLDAMRRDSVFVDFYNSFPIAGVDGTIEQILVGTPAQNNARAKTGSMDRVRALSGYVTTADGRMLMFSLMANAYAVRGADVDNDMGDIVLQLATLRLGS